MDLTDRMIYWVKIPKVSMGIVVGICVVEFFMIFMHRSEALPKKHYDKFMIYRRLVGLLLLLFVWFCFRGIYAWDGHAEVEAIVDGECTTDGMLHETFV